MMFDFLLNPRTWLALARRDAEPLIDALATAVTLPAGAHTLRTAPEIGTGTCSIVDVPLPRSVLAHRFDAPAGSILLLHNLADTPAVIDIGPQQGMDGLPYDLLVDGPYEAPTGELDNSN